ncbi:type II secretion system F family protein [Mycolicibacterium vaccae]|uniref:Type II secretion system protein n=2 Tax=Mycolicibacterium vaccae TaxID=1810 RepID=K0UTB8_MYCVA|nr:type II secretion system F family protein [Mycolicibacterium vaccae]ANI42345.1 membrane protein [Mycolicibacterium vaccae 95051]EJZ10397.1 type II secretion system protein [Mycolicibacterium vaccae ATCC 25954]MCV7060661.1 type II secretion system F family protein [Mycolicibacterium vaccae]
MTAAALALAAAVLVAPSGSHRRARAVLERRPRRLRMSAPVGAVLVCAAVALLMTPGAALAVGMLAATLLGRARATQRRRDSVAEAVSLQGALDVLVGELRIGAHPVAAVRAAAHESNQAVSGSLTGVAARALLGADVADGLRAAGRRSLLPGYWERLGVCWGLAQNQGLAIATLMQAAQRDIAERERFRGRVDAGLAGARATAAILAGLPVLGMLLGHMIGADPLGFLLSGGAGGWLLVIGTGLVCAGLLWSDRIMASVMA